MAGGRSRAVIRAFGTPGDLGWVVGAHGEIYALEYGWSTQFEALVARIATDFVERHDSASEGAWIAELDGHPVGCVFCVASDTHVQVDDARGRTAKLRILLVHPDGRGQGLGGRLVDVCLAFARQVGYVRIELWTNHPLTHARRVYEARGFTLIAEKPHHSFGVDLIGQTYELDLRHPDIPDLTEERP